MIGAVSWAFERHKKQKHALARSAHFACFFCFSWGHFGHILGPSWATLGPYWAVSGPSQGQFGMFWGHLGPFWGHLAPKARANMLQIVLPCPKMTPLLGLHHCFAGLCKGKRKQKHDIARNAIFCILLFFLGAIEGHIGFISGPSWIFLRPS